MSRALNDLDPRFLPVAIELSARITEAGIPHAIIDTLRTPEEHAANLAKGTSWTRHSRHMDGLAIDLAPYKTYELHGPDKIQWDADDPAWQRMGEIGEGLGLKWGVWVPRDAVVPDWRRRGKLVNIDLGHFEMRLDT